MHIIYLYSLKLLKLIYRESKGESTKTFGGSLLGTAKIGDNEFRVGVRVPKISTGQTSWDIEATFQYVGAVSFHCIIILYERDFTN